MKARAFSVLAMFPFLFAVGGCSNDAGSGDKGTIAMASSSLSRDRAPKVTTADAEELREGNTAFATDLYATLRTGALAGKNVFFSPHSISTAMAMTHAGARGTTESQIASGLHFTLPQDRLHPAFDALDLALAQRADATHTKDVVPFELKIVNSSWAPQGMPFVPTYLDTLARSYGAGVRLTNFERDAEGSRKIINGWVADETNDKVLELLPGGSISSNTRLVLVNAVYFNASWDLPFVEAATKPAAFHGKGGDVTVPTMHQTERLGYAEGQGWKAAELLFASNDVAFDVVVPDDVEAFEGSLDARTIASITAAFTPRDVAIALPKFKLEGESFRLKSALQSRGIVDAFDGGIANFSGLSDAPLFIDDVLHQAFLSVEEKGVEAAAATAVVGIETSV